MRTFGAMFVGGAVGLLLLKLLFPLLAIFVGLVALVLKVILFGVVAYFIYSLVRGKKREMHEPV